MIIPPFSPIRLNSCPKTWRRDLDKAISPEETCKRVRSSLEKQDLDIVSSVRRIDTGRLGIPVYLSVCGADARGIMPTRKQMGKGSSPAQAQASALMELMERYAFFSFWNRKEQFLHTGWRQARSLFGDSLIPVSEILRSVNDQLPLPVAESLLDLASWQFYPATRLDSGQIVWLPLDWFRMLGEFNGSSAGNTQEESLLQGIGELIERHVSCIADAGKPVLPTLDPESFTDPVLLDLVSAFKRANIKLILKDMTLDMPMPTVAALAWDPATWPASSEIVFTAGTASSPEKAAIRAITEVAQLGGDFHTNSCYEASGLSKYASLEEAAWLLQGPVIRLDQMPSLEDSDIRTEIDSCLERLQPVSVYAVETTNPTLKIPAHYCVAPGLQFRERAKNQSLGLFLGRKLVEEFPLSRAMESLEKIEQALPKASYIPFFRGLALLNNGHSEESKSHFRNAISLQAEAESQAMAEFYYAYALTQSNDWPEAIPYLQSATAHCAQVKEYHNLLGVAHFKTGSYAEAEDAFNSALKLDKGSAMDLANRGICRKLQGNRQGALDDLLTALELDPQLDFIKSHLDELTRP